MNIFKKIKNFLNKRKNAPCIIAADEVGIRFLQDNSTIGKFQWDECSKIVTYKDDLLTTDLICLEFELSNGTVYLAHEEQPGFEDLISALSTAFPGIDGNWYVEVMTPAFERNYRVLHPEHNK
ncbi:hypothetical protein MNKW57_06950 [Biformimicrobium ophioploci]|uniref:Uncharacterized protein n=1 Tax=Biformimicrobium ophioploci TaxID=3036711 RepID=A0ABQ6LWC0_9GAMM|nr:hypothetical protein MNKW57_06950 [Microbulbifer sp. NKW57]